MSCNTMDDTYQHPVFFECASLDGEQKRRIENYFRIRRKSGGGECGSLTNINDKVCSIAFKDQDAQQRVLQRCEHVLEFADGSLVLIVRGNPGPASKSVSPKLDLNPSQQKDQSILISGLQPSGEEYVLQIDPYLLRYLKECPKAGKQLEDKLASVASCSAQLYPEEGRVIVRSLARPGAAYGGRSWKAQVDNLFDGYACHHEVDPHKVTTLLKSCSSNQTTDEVKVYSEDGVAVVVGERSQVKARLVDVDDLLVKQGSHLRKKQRTVRRLGKAKVRLLWKEIEDSLGRDFPGVKVTQGDAGQLVLEGSVQDILNAGEVISDKENLVSEKKVSDLSPHFLAFLKKAYEGPGELGDFLEVGNEVEIELQATELRFFALSADKLEETEKKLHEKLKEVKIEVPNCSAEPAELWENLESKMNVMNQGQHRAQVVFGSGSTVCLLGHTKEVDELTEAVRQIILDRSSVESKVAVPFPELVQLLPQLLQLQKFDYSGVTFYPLTSSSRPMVVLQGPSSKVTEVRNRLGPVLDSLVQDTVTIDLAAAARYFLSPSGRENILSVARSRKCLVQVQEQPRTTRQNLASLSLSEVNTTVASYSLSDGFQVLVCQGDITKQNVDALVNAANEDLEHGGGVAAALSKAGGPEVQRESRAIVMQTGKIPTGGVVVTTGGNLNCKKLLHAVGPRGRYSGGKERMLLEKTVKSTLDLAEMMEFKSIAVPCISSGLFNVPITTCSEAIVTAIKTFGSHGGRSLRRVILIDKRGNVVRELQGACDLLLRGIATRNNSSDLELEMGAAAKDAAGGASAEAPGDAVHVEVIQGTIQTQQVDCMISPMVGHDPLSSRVGNVLAEVVGSQLTTKFHKEARGVTLLGDSVLVAGLPALQTKGVFFLNLVPWDNNQHGGSVQVLRQGIRKILTTCENRGFSSVALPVLGTGTALHFPHIVASRAILEEVRLFEQNRASRTSFLVRIVIHPNDKESSKAFQSTQDSLHLRGFINNSNPHQASFYRHVTGKIDEVTAMLGGVKLQMVLGNIINERTDAIINTTNFSSNPSGVSKTILTAAGPAVQAELARGGAQVDFFTTGPGALSCREIIHASFMCEPQTIRKKCKKILKHCESCGYRSAAFPAINTGAAGMDPVDACKAMLDGMTSAIMALKPKSLSLIRIVILQQPIFQAFRSELENRFGQTATRHLNLQEKAKQKLKQWKEKCSRTSTTAAAQDKNFIFMRPLPAVISVIGCSTDTIRAVKRDLEVILQKQLIERYVNVDDFSRLDTMVLESLQAKIKVSEISMEYKKENIVGDQPGGGGYVLTGLTEDILGVTELVNRAIQKALCEDLQDKREALLALIIQWLIQDVNGAWQELSMHDNYLLEEAHMKGQVSWDVMGLDGMMVKVNLIAREATNWQTGHRFKVQRRETQGALELPPQWEPMNDESFKRVELQPHSSEYYIVAQDFLKTANYTIRKIERVQNLYLWHAYSVCRQRIFTKNGSADLGEKSLYHGTSAEACKCIERDRFDRSYAGAHAAAFGKGVYFAVNAKYSADGFSPADLSGLKRLYVARVLTGRYTKGKASMIAPPPRGSDPTDCFDSVVDNEQQPSKFVIFHDDQAYPEYLITFS